MTKIVLEKFVEGKIERLKEMYDKEFLIAEQNIERYISRVKNNASAELNENFWRDRRVLITGVAGMVGSTIADILSALGAEVHGVVRRHATMNYPNIDESIKKGKLKTHEADLKDYKRCEELVAKIEPEVIFHQAAESFVPTSLTHPSYVTENNTVSTTNILEAAAQGNVDCSVQVACSSEQYGFIKNIDELPVKETAELRPTSTYAATKVFTEYIAKAYNYMYGLKTYITRTFNQEGPRRGPQFFTSRVAIQVVDCLKNGKEEIVIGNPLSVRDFTHIYDTSRAQMLVVEKGDVAEPYNVCSGVGVLMGDYVKLAVKEFGLQDKVKIFVNTDLLRPYEQRGDVLFHGFIGDNTKIREKTGWAPQHTVLDIIRDEVEFYKARGV